MDIQDLPVFAHVYPGETVRSWLDATRRCLGLSEDEWWDWCACDPDEPERPLGRRAWRGLPSELGSIDSVPVDFRIAPGARVLQCPSCAVWERWGQRFPVVAMWLDVRSVCCEEHGLLLGGGSPRARVSIHEDPELMLWHLWLNEWRVDGSISQIEKHFRRDLVLAGARNWGPGRGPIASAEVDWELRQRGWLDGPPGRHHEPGGPGRIGSLHRADRLSALFGAWRAWLAMQGQLAGALPHWPLSAWVWLERRWRDRGGCGYGKQLSGVVDTLSRRHEAPLKRSSSSVRR